MKTPLSLRTFVWPLTLVGFAALVALVSGASYLEARLPGGLPAGNALASLAFCCLGGAAIGLSTAGTLLRRVCIGAFALGAGWLPLSVALAGNLTLNFSGAAGAVWIAVTVTTMIAVVGSFFWALIRSRVG